MSLTPANLPGLITIAFNFKFTSYWFVSRSGVPDNLRPAIGGVQHPGKLLHGADLSFLFPHDVVQRGVGGGIPIGAGGVVVVVDGDAFHCGKLTFLAAAPQSVSWWHRKSGSSKPLHFKLPPCYVRVRGVLWV